MYHSQCDRKIVRVVCVFVSYELCIIIMYHGHFVQYVHGGSSCWGQLCIQYRTYRVLYISYRVPYDIIIPHFLSLSIEH